MFKILTERISNYVVHDSVVLHVKGATEGRKRFNERNGDLLLKRWGKEIKKIESVNDQVFYMLGIIFIEAWFAHFPQTFGNGSKPS